MLPSWDASLGLATRDTNVLNQMQTGYPRFFIHRTIKKLAGHIVERFGDIDRDGSSVDARSSTEREDGSKNKTLAMLFPCGKHVLQCAEFLKPQASTSRRVITLRLGLASECLELDWVDWAKAEFYAVLFPSDLFPLAKSFWQHTGFGVSSRYAEFCLEQICKLEVQAWMDFSSSEQLWKICANDVQNEAVDPRRKRLSGASVEGTTDQKTKYLLRQRISELASTSECHLDASDVYLFSSGMGAISTVAEALPAIKRSNESHAMVSYGFLYVDIFKVLSKVFGYETTLYGHVTASELDSLESQLEAGHRICALFCEFPGNPLLRSPDLHRVRQLADRYDFIIICDDTVGTFVNVDLMPYVDVVCTSLSKMFSGACNVLGGSVVLNPCGKYYQALRIVMATQFVDTFSPLDAVVMEANSRDFVSRMKRANASAEMVCEILEKHPAVAKIYYPKDSSTQELYDSCKRSGAGYGYLLSVQFVTPASAIRFFNALDVAKGPGFGMNFTLAAPYTLLAHYGEREWAAQYGVTEHLVRITVGLEVPDELAGKVKADRRSKRYWVVFKFDKVFTYGT